MIYVVYDRNEKNCVRAAYEAPFDTPSEEARKIIAQVYAECNENGNSPSEVLADQGFVDAEWYSVEI